MNEKTTILYPLDARNIENYAILAADFCEGPIRAKVQLGAPWWFNDQSYGIKRQFEAVSNLYPIALSVGMLTDSRSFLKNQLIGSWGRFAQFYITVYGNLKSEKAIWSSLCRL